MDTSKLLRIKIERLVTGRALVREVFLAMPKNDKVLRLARSGDELRDSLLARLLRKEGAEIYVIPRDGAAEDPETCPLFAGEEQSEAALVPPRAEAPAAGSSPSSAATLEAAEEEARAATPPIEDAPVAVGATAGAEEATSVSPDVTPPEESTAVAAAQEAPVDVRKVKPAADEEAASRIQALGFLLDAAAQRAQEAAKTTETTISGAADEAAAAFLSRGSLDPGLSTAANPETEAAPEERRAPANGSLEELATKLVAAAEQENSDALRSQAHAIRDLVEQSRSAAGEEDENASLRLALALQNSAETFRLTAESEGSRTIREHAENLGDAIKTFTASAEDFAPAKTRQQPAEEQNFDNVGMMADAAAALTVLRASEELERAAKALFTSKAGAEALERRISELRTIIEEVTVSGKTNPGLRNRFDINGDLKSLERAIDIGGGAAVMEDLLRRTEEARSSAELAYQMSRGSGEESESDPLTIAVVQGTELPAVVGRLAATLAVALGYTDLKYLYELSLGAILYFARKEGDSVSEENLPTFSRALMHAQRAGNGFTAEDGVGVISFLDAYLHSPACDRTQRDLSKRTLTQTLDALPQDEEGPDDWSRARWTQFATLGPTIESQSLCTKASAWALRDSKAFVS